MRKALVFGVDGKRNASHGACVASALMFATFLAKRSFEVRLLTDDDAKLDSKACPTAQNIEIEIGKFVANANEGDELVLYCCGHAFGSDVDDYDEHGIYGADLEVISCKSLTSMLSKLPKNCSCTVILDTCYSGEMIRNLEEQFSPTANGRTNDGRSQKQLTFFSSCERFEKSGACYFGDEDDEDYEDDEDVSVFTYVMCNYVRPSSVREWLLECRRTMRDMGFDQVPRLFCCEGNVHKHFICAPSR